jgi:hypothetical protein
MLRQENFVEDVQLRNAYINRVETLDRVKILTMLPDDEHLTTKMISEYYLVEDVTIRQIIVRNNDELVQDGLKVVKGNELKHIKSTLLQNVTELKKIPSLTLLNRRCVLRIGMLLQKSEIAKQVRTYLLNVEQYSTQQHRSKAVTGSSWDNKDLILYDIIINEVNRGGTLNSACAIASAKLGKSQNACRSRYTSSIKPKIQNEELKRKIEGNKRNIHDNSENSEELTDFKGYKKPSWQEMMLNSVLVEFEEMKKSIEGLQNEKIALLEDKIETLQLKNAALQSALKKLKSEKEKISDELIQTKGIIASAIDIKVSSEIKTAFRMDKNGNLERTK